MKKEDQDITILDSDINLDKDYIKNSFKTTNINILLNRVRHNKKKNLIRKFIFFGLLLAFIGIIVGITSIYY